MTYMFDFTGLFPREVYKGGNKYNKSIRVIKAGKEIKLIVNGFVQSFSKNSRFAEKRVWGKLTNLVAQKAPNAKGVLLLGLGAGTMIHFLQEKLAKNSPRFTCVEIDKEIVDVAYKFFELEEVKNLKVICEDAYEVVANPNKYGVEGNFDCIIVDTYLGDICPDNIRTGIFLQNLLKLSQQETLLVFNKVVKKDQQHEISEFESQLSPYIKNIGVVKVKCPVISDNYLFYGYAKQAS